MGRGIRGELLMQCVARRYGSYGGLVMIKCMMVARLEKILFFILFESSLFLLVSNIFSAFPLKNL